MGFEQKIAKGAKVARPPYLFGLAIYRAKIPAAPC